METQTNYPNPRGTARQSFVQRNALSVKIALIGALILLLLIPMAMVRGVINERVRTAENAVREVQDKWSNAQVVAGPYIEIPFEEEVASVSYEGDRQKTSIRKLRKTLYLLPETLDISGTVETQTLRRGQYEVVVYKTPLELTGTFTLPQAADVPAADSRYLWAQASFCMGLSDLRGISEQVEISWSGAPLECHSGLPAGSLASTGVAAALPALKAGDTVRFAVRLHLKGSQALQFTPFGKTTRVRLVSDCPTPSFNGAFLPEEREVTADGFTAEWQVLNLNRNYPQRFTSDWKTNNLREDASEAYDASPAYDNKHDYSSTARNGFSLFGVDLLLPVEQYQQATRSAKYASLFIILTFVICFFVEVTRKKCIHPFQYLLVGLALCLFYTLLLSLSEYLGFAWAYLIAALMTVALLVCYLAGLLRLRRTALLIGALLALLYAYIYVLLQMETYALLAGSIGLFAILALIMRLSLKINWSGNEPGQGA